MRHYNDREAKDQFIMDVVKEKQPKPIGPTEADNWEYIGERWVKKEKAQ